MVNSLGRTIPLPKHPVAAILFRVVAPDPEEQVESESKAPETDRNQCKKAPLGKRGTENGKKPARDQEGKSPSGVDNAEVVDPFCKTEAGEHQERIQEKCSGYHQKDKGNLSHQGLLQVRWILRKRLFNTR